MRLREKIIPNLISLNEFQVGSIDVSSRLELLTRNFGGKSGVLTSNLSISSCLSPIRSRVSFSKGEVRGKTSGLDTLVLALITVGVAHVSFNSFNRVKYFMTIRILNIYIPSYRPIGIVLFCHLRHLYPYISPLSSTITNQGIFNIAMRE